MKKFFSTYFLIGCLLSLMSHAAIANGDANLDAVTTPYKVLPGENYQIDVFYRADQAYDLAIDFLDDSGWLDGKRVVVDASPSTSQTFVSVPFTIPNYINNPDSVFFAVKLIPVGQSWDKFVDERLIPTTVSSFARVTPYFPVSLSFTPATASAQLHNSGTAIVSFDNEGLVATVASSVSGQETYKLDLNNGTITRNYVFEQYDVQESSITNPPTQDGGLLDYLSKLNSLKQAVNQLYGVGASSQRVLSARDVAIDYIDAIIAHLDSEYAEKVTLSPYANTAAIGGVKDFHLPYTVEQNRDILVTLFDANKNSIATARTSVAAGSGTATISVDVPAELANGAKGWMTAKVVPQGGDWTDYIFNDYVEVQYIAF